MGHAGPQLAQRAEPLIAPHLGLVAAELLGHRIDRQGQVADLVVAAGDRHRLEHAAGHPRRLVAKLLDRPHEAMGQERRDQDRGQGRQAAGDQRRVGGPADRLRPAVLGIEHDQRAGRRLAGADHGHPIAHVGPAAQRDHRRRRERFTLAGRRDAAQQGQFLRAGAERAGLEPLVAVQRDELGPGKLAHLTQHALGQGERGPSERGHHPAQALFLLPLRPLAAEIGLGRPGQHDRQHHHRKRGQEQLDLDRPPHGPGSILGPSKTQNRPF
jgi:hypothetical protein